MRSALIPFSGNVIGFGEIELTTTVELSPGAVLSVAGNVDATGVNNDDSILKEIHFLLLLPHN